MNSVVGKVAFITGGVSGIGLGLARTLESAGMKVVITYVRKKRMEQAMRFFEHTDRVHAIQLDVLDPAAVIRAADETEATVGAVDLLCNNAGVMLFGAMDEATLEDWNWVLGVNLMGPVNIISTFVPRMKARRQGGHILNVASMSAMLSGPESGIYTTSKFALRGLSESLRYCLAPYGIGVSLLCPGLVQSRIYESSENRPAHLARSGFPVSAEINRRWREIQELGMDPLEVGKKTLTGIIRNDMYIFTHPETREELSQYHGDIIRAFPNEPPDPKRLPVVEARRRRLQIRNSMSANTLDQHDS